MGRFIHPGGASTIKALKEYASVTEAALVDVEDGYAGTPIYVRTKPSSPQTVTNSGGTVTNNADGSTTYGFPGGTYYPSDLRVLDRSQIEDYGNYQGATAAIQRVLSGTYVKKPKNPTFANSSGLYRVQKFYGTAEGWGTISFPSSWYDCTTWDYYLEGFSYDYVGYFASSGSPGGGGSVTVKPYTPEIVRGQRIQQGVLTQATTENLPFDYYTYIPSAAEESSGTFLVQGASTAVQNFAFDGMDDFE